MKPIAYIVPVCHLCDRYYLWYLIEDNTWFDQMAYIVTVIYITQTTNDVRKLVIKGDRSFISIAPIWWYSSGNDLMCSLPLLVFIWYSWGLDSNMPSVVCALNGYGYATTVVPCISTLQSGWIEDGWTYLRCFLTMETVVPPSIQLACYNGTGCRLWTHKKKTDLNRGNESGFHVLNYSIAMFMQ